MPTDPQLYLIGGWQTPELALLKLQQLGSILVVLTVEVVMEAVVVVVAAVEQVASRTG